MTISMAFLGGSLGPGEILLVSLVILLLFGARRLPSIARSLGRTLEEFRRATRNLSHDIMTNNDKHDSSVPPSKTPLPSDPSSEEKERKG